MRLARLALLVAPAVLATGCVTVDTLRTRPDTRYPVTEAAVVLPGEPLGRPFEVVGVLTDGSGTLPRLLLRGPVERALLREARALGADAVYRLRPRVYVERSMSGGTLYETWRREPRYAAIRLLDAPDEGPAW